MDSLRKIGHSILPCRILGTLCRSQNKALEGRELMSDVLRRVHISLQRLLVRAVRIAILPRVHFVVMVVVCGYQAAKG